MYCASFGVRALQYPIQTLTYESIAWILDSLTDIRSLWIPKKLLNCTYAGFPGFLQDSDRSLRGCTPKILVCPPFCVGAMETKFGNFYFKLSRFVEAVDLILQTQSMGMDCIETIFIMALD